MIGRRRILAEETVNECQHPEAQSGEIWITNKPTDGAARFAEQHHYRVGTTAYNKMSNVVEDFQPVFGPAEGNKSHSCQGYCHYTSSGGLKV
jgi:hypothetical protein